MNDSPLHTETTSKTTTFEHFGREWTVPTEQDLDHILRLREAFRDGSRTGFFDVDLVISEVFLSPEDFAELLKIRPKKSDLEEFTQKVSEALGLQSPGNSKPSATSS